MTPRRRNPLLRPTVIAALSALVATACIGGEDETLDDLYGMDGPLEPTPPIGKEDSENRRGLWVNTNTRATQVWTARNNWEDTDTAAARAAGIAWGEDSGLNWDEKYQLWVAEMTRTSGDSYYDTFMLTTPWGKTLPSPRLECAELSMFLRMTFASWYELPFFMEAVDRHGKRIYFGHNGIRTKDGRYANTPNFGYSYKDHTADWQPGDAWPEDSTLRGRKLWGGDDTQVVNGEETHFGAYVDEIHLNKRAGYFVMLTINYLGSVNLADSANTYNIVPEAVRAGDVLLHRWQRRGIGHTLVVKEVLDTGEGTKDVTVLSGSMPRRQGKWEDGVRSKQYFTSNHGGGIGESSDGDEYAKLGGGLRRYRVTKNVNGYWTNTWMSADEAHWINSTDYGRIAERPSRFETMLGQVSPEEIRDSLAAQIEDARRHLQNYPASCAARERRENAFRDLYDVMSREFGIDRAAVDAEYRKLEDFAFRELVYDRSKTCCWNSTNRTMYEVVMDKVRADLAEAEANGECREPLVFMNDNGYGVFRDYAEATGRGAAWMPWSEDESCAQRDVASDTVAEDAELAYCSLPADDGGDTGACTDAFEPNDSQDTGATVSGTHDLQLCDGDEDWFLVEAAGRVSISFEHSAGDLDMSAHSASGERVGISQSVSNSESLTVEAGTWIRVYGYQGATGAYTLTVE